MISTTMAVHPETGTLEADMSAWEASLEASLVSTMRRKFDDDGEEQFDVDDFDFEDDDEEFDDEEREDADDEEKDPDDDEMQDDFSFDDEDEE